MAERPRSPAHGARRRRAGPALALSIQTGPRVPAIAVSRARLRRWVLAALQSDARITLRFVGAAEGRALNRAYRGKDYATNVLTFAYPADATGAAVHATAADIVICVPVLTREARAQRKPWDHHLAHLVIHGVLHAQGLEHDDEIEAQAMEALETALLRRFRIADPYGESARPAGRGGSTDRAA